MKFYQEADLFFFPQAVESIKHFDRLVSNFGDISVLLNVQYVRGLRVNCCLRFLKFS